MAVPDVVYLYLVGPSDVVDETLAPVLRRFDQLRGERPWSFFAPSVVDRRDERDANGEPCAEVGLELAFVAVDAASLGETFDHEVATVQQCLDDLRAALGADFVLGVRVQGGAAEDLDGSEGDRGLDLAPHLLRLALRPTRPKGYPRRSVRFDHEDGRAVAVVGDRRVAFGRTYELVFRLADGTRDVEAIVEEVARTRAAGVGQEPTTAVLEALRTLHRDGHLRLVARPTALPDYLRLPASEHGADAADAMLRAGFDPARAPGDR